MRFLHTGDWHVGKLLKGRSRQEEHARALDEIVGIARDERVDALLIGGDVFDVGAPPPEAEKLVWETLARCASEGMAIVLIGGNHEHPRKLAALQALLDPLRIFVRAEPVGPTQGGIITLPSRDGTETGQVAVLPFASETRIAQASNLFDPVETWYQAYSERVARMLDLLAQAFRPDCANVMLAHLMVSGGLIGGGERPAQLLDVYGIAPERLPGGAQYIGLNHLHRPQRLPSAAWCEYSGSPIQLDFGEREQAKRVVIVDARAGRPVDVKSVPLTSGRRLLDARGTLEALRTQAPDLRDAWLRVIVDVPQPTPGIEVQVRELLPDAVQVTQEYPTTARPEDESPPPARSIVAGETAPTELLRDFYRETRRAELPAPVAALFGRLYEVAQHETD